MTFEPQRLQLNYFKQILYRFTTLRSVHLRGVPVFLVLFIFSMLRNKLKCKIKKKNTIPYTSRVYTTENRCKIKCKRIFIVGVFYDCGVDETVRNGYIRINGHLLRTHVHNVIYVERKSAYIP